MPSRKGGGTQWKEQDVLQAVVLADSFNTRFAPLTQHRPRALLPIANTTLLDHTLELLAVNEVREVFILCCAFADQLKAYIDGSHWVQEKQFVVKLINAPRCLSVGEALKEIDATGLITHQFVLVTADVVGNLKLAETIAAHKARVTKDKDDFMTMVLKEARPGHAMRSSRTEERLMAIDKADGRLLAYTQFERLRAFVPTQALAEAAAVQIRNDLLATGVFICSPEVPMLFTDNFDYSSMDDLIRAVLGADETSSHRIFTTITHEEYAYQVCDIQRYDAVSKDILNRWVYPLVPDVFSPGEATTAFYKRNHLYLQPNVYLARSCVLDAAVLIGSGSRVGSDEDSTKTHITGSTIGKNCTIGSGVSLANAYLWDNVVVGDNVKIDKAILGFGVRILDNVVIEPGCIFADGVVIGPDVIVPAGSRFTLQPIEEDGWGEKSGERDSEEEPEYDWDDVGKEGRGYLWEDYEGEEDGAVIWGAEPSEQPQSEEEDGSSASEFEDGSGSELEQGYDDFEYFYEEIFDLILTRIDRKNIRGTLTDSLALEISGSRSANEMSPRDVVRAVVRAVVNSAKDETSAKATSIYLKAVFVKIGEILRNYSKHKEDQVALIGFLEESVIEFEYALPTLQSLLHAMYEDDTLSEQAITEWYEEHKVAAQKDETKALLHKQVSPLIEWLLNADEESSAEESSSEEEEEEEEEE